MLTQKISHRQMKKNVKTTTAYYLNGVCVESTSHMTPADLADQDAEHEAPLAAYYRLAPQLLTPEKVAAMLKEEGYR